MTTLQTLEVLVAGLWLGSYLFTTLVVSPALKSLPLDDSNRIGIRSAVGRRFGRLAGPLFLLWLALLLLQGFAPMTLLRLALFAVLATAVGLHGYYAGTRMQALAEREAAGGGPGVQAARRALQRLSARITPVSLVASVLLAVLALF